MAKSLRSVIQVKIDVEKTIKQMVEYSWNLFCKHFCIEYTYTTGNCDISIGFDPSSTIQLSHDFYHKILHKEYSWKSYFSDTPLIKTDTEKPDYLSTSFYLVNCIQEHSSTAIDSIGRFEYRHSLQKQFSCIKDDLVSSYFEKLKESVPLLKAIPHQIAASNFFISHDNDTFHASFLQDGLWALKNGRLDIVLKLIILEILKKPGWINLDNIMDINDEHGIKSTFFWLVNQGDTDLKKGLKNADYNFDDLYVQQQIKNVEVRGFYNGLHKSISQENYKEEANRLTFTPISNRNHYLRLNVEDHYQELDKARISLDFSLGFAEHYGFRNSYGVPFRPFDLS
ncbi:MAG: hypothetical protein JKY42_07010, partial [Flavobacteriales bacterium]|nr:hypothetical protein [Flavobacteriales bacterium]